VRGSSSPVEQARHVRGEVFWSRSSLTPDPKPQTKQPNPHTPHPHVAVGQHDQHSVYGGREGAGRVAGEQGDAALDALGDAAAEHDAAAVEVPATHTVTYTRAA
jgi:hypothetical protein